MRWQKVVLPGPSEESVHIAVQLTTQIQKRGRQVNEKDFAVFNTYEYKDANTEFHVFYFSPVAVQNCRDILAPFQPVDCDKPEHEGSNTLGFSLSYGDFRGSTSWDLLK